MNVSVIVDNGKSVWENVASGLQQECVQCPTLVVTFINDLLDVITNTVKIFADDTKMYRKINDISDQILLQEDLNK